MRVVVVFASVIIALIVLSLFIVASYGYPQYSMPYYMQPTPLSTNLYSTFAAPQVTYPSYSSSDVFMNRESYIPSYSMATPIMAAPVQTMVPVPVPVPMTSVMIPSQPVYSQPGPQYSPQYSQPSPPRETIQERSSTTEKSSKGGSGFKIGSKFSIPNDIADKLFPFSIRIASHGEPHLP